MYLVAVTNSQSCQERASSSRGVWAQGYSLPGVGVTMTSDAFKAGGCSLTSEETLVTHHN